MSRYLYSVRTLSYPAYHLLAPSEEYALNATRHSLPYFILCELNAINTLQLIIEINIINFTLCPTSVSYVEEEHATPCTVEHGRRFSGHKPDNTMNIARCASSERKRTSPRRFVRNFASGIRPFDDVGAVLPAVDDVRKAGHLILVGSRWLLAF